MGTMIAINDGPPLPFLRRQSKMYNFRRMFESIISSPPETEFIYHDEEPPQEAAAPNRRNTRSGVFGEEVSGEREKYLVLEMLLISKPRLKMHVTIIFSDLIATNLSGWSCRINTKTYQILKLPSEDKIFTTIKQIIPSGTCPLIKLFPREEKPKDKASKRGKLSSFERKRRYHQTFGVDHHAKEQLFCPLQASQVELAFKTQIKADIVIKIQAPNGECSGYIYPNNLDFTSFTPTNIGCGHGKWLIHVAVRRGCKFHHGQTRQLNLVGQGILFFEVNMVGDVKDCGRLWLDCLN
ncbi:Protein CBG17517 [Caenorhabditis briggsae]|uniref:Protein CBG17517 n=1 Tax=Caenorhabditis briggsae TaxID=6238 RepID=A8XRD2_CAEBR|nr:Protein CBG17517 [Caenorhabditis briggsae]CAP35151.2 Protein CBG17517 [Caenorhabditis briggsae]